MRYQAVVFDFHGTLAHPAEGSSGYRQVLTRRGYDLDDHAIEGWIETFDGADHRAHSADEASYLVWARGRLDVLAERAGVPAGPLREEIVAELDRWGSGPVVAYREAPDVLHSLKVAGLRVAVCSNWGWHLDPFIEQAGLERHVDLAVSSARVGARKPHPAIYAHTLAQLGTPAAATLFVGDNLAADVSGPLAAGFGGAIHVWRPGRHRADDPPALPAGNALRTSDLTGVLDVVWS